MKKSLTLADKILKRLSTKTANVFVRDDFKDLSDYDQVGRALKHLTDKGILIKIGYGLYAKTRVSALTGETVLAASLPNLGKEALKRLKVRIAPSRAEIEYNTGRSTQVPTGRLIGVKRRVSRKIGYKGAFISYEYGS
jgi:hypothetical protein